MYYRIFSPTLPRRRVTPGLPLRKNGTLGARRVPLGAHAVARAARPEEDSAGNDDHEHHALPEACTHTRAPVSFLCSSSPAVRRAGWQTSNVLDCGRPTWSSGSPRPSPSESVLRYDGPLAGNVLAGDSPGICTCGAITESENRLTASARLRQRCMAAACHPMRGGRGERDGAAASITAVFCPFSVYSAMKMAAAGVPRGRHPLVSRRGGDALAYCGSPLLPTV